MKASKMTNNEEIKAETKTTVTPADGKRQKAKPVAPADAKPTAPPEPTRPASKGKLGSLFGHSIVSVIRCLGKEGWTFEQAEAALKKAGITAATHTIKIGLKRGRDGQKRIAPLSATELATLAGTPAKTKKSKKAAPAATQVAA